MNTVRVLVTLKPSILDSAGRTVASSLKSLGFDEVHSARIGKMIELDIENPTDERVGQMCKTLLANEVIENYTFEVLK